MKGSKMTKTSKVKQDVQVETNVDVVIEKQLPRVDWNDHDERLNNYKYMSTKIRFLHSVSWTPTQIKNKLTEISGQTVIYQWVRNELNRTVTKYKEAL